MSPLHCRTLHAFSQCCQYTVTLSTSSHSVAITLSHSPRLLTVSPIYCYTLHAFSQCRHYTVTLYTPSHSVAITLSHSARLLTVLPIHCHTSHSVAITLSHSARLLTVSPINSNNSLYHNHRYTVVVSLIHCVANTLHTLCCQYTLCLQYTVSVSPKLIIHCVSNHQYSV